jgi:hypothetical protein
MRKGKYIDYTVLLACLSKMPEPQQLKNESLVNGEIESSTIEETQKEKGIKVLELEPA